MFATGIENSSPTIKNGRERVDEMEKCGHYKLWSADSDCVQELGLCFLRYGIPLHRVFLGPRTMPRHFFGQQSGGWQGHFVWNVHWVSFLVKSMARRESPLSK
jgi:hypothetical protein